VASSSTNGARAKRRRARAARRRAERRTGRPAAAKARALPDRALLLPALAGVALAGYLALVAWWDATPAACAPGSGCETVQGSRFGSLLGAPIAAWGAAGYAALTWVAWRVRSPRRRGFLALALSGPGLAISVYLTGISLFVIGAACVWCLASLLLMTACFVAALRAQPVAFRPVPRTLATTAALSLLAVAGLHLSFRAGLAAGPEDPRLRALARHLADSGAVFYGAAWCDHCAQQKAFFGPSAHRLPYVECSPNGRRAAPARECRESGVAAYPTWVIGGERLEGLQPPEQLARIAGFDLGEDGQGGAGGPGGPAP